MDNETKPSAAARRQFLADTARMACGVGLLGLGVGLYARHAKALPPAAVKRISKSYGTIFVHRAPPCVTRLTKKG